MKTRSTFAVNSQERPGASGKGTVQSGQEAAASVRDIRASSLAQLQRQQVAERCSQASQLKAHAANMLAGNPIPSGKHVARAGTVQLKRTEVGARQETARAYEQHVAVANEPALATNRVVMTFGSDVGQLGQLIDENRATAEARLNPKYVIGVNVGPTDVNPPKGQKKPTMDEATEKAVALKDYGGDVGMFVIPFTWKRGEAADAMYEFPYFEARSMLMSAALDLRSAESHTVYAMTDRDARDSAGINPADPAAGLIDGHLNDQAAGVVSGPYAWREEEPGNSRLDAIVTIVNDAERDFRHWKTTNGLFTYLPEPNLFFNEAGVREAMKRLQEKPLKGTQARESDAIRGEGMAEHFEPTARVTKPAKVPVNKKAYLDGVYTLVKGFKKHTPVTKVQVQTMFDNIIQSELSTSNVKEMTKSAQAAMNEAARLLDIATTSINAELKKPAAK